MFMLHLATRIHTLLFNATLPGMMLGIPNQQMADTSRYIVPKTIIK